ncbi:MAG: DUF4258 domain-containing protein [Oscillospiraceae bacterium]|nr:DUF4258 domain-containing protein [Oscillospiraceae bacterium]
MIIENYKTLASANKIFWTEHVALRLRGRKIKRIDVIACIQNGEIIEQYPDDTPFPSCLIYGKSTTGKPLHIVCGINENTNIYVITAYYPSLNKWEDDYKTRKAGK